MEGDARLADTRRMADELACRTSSTPADPLYDEDPDVPGLRYGQLIAWVTVMTEFM